MALADLFKGAGALIGKLGGMGTGLVKAVGPLTGAVLQYKQAIGGDIPLSAEIRKIQALLTEMRRVQNLANDALNKRLPALARAKTAAATEVPTISNIFAQAKSLADAAIPILNTAVEVGIQAQAKMLKGEIPTVASLDFMARQNLAVNKAAGVQGVFNVADGRLRDAEARNLSQQATPMVKGVGQAVWQTGSQAASWAGSTAQSVGQNIMQNLPAASEAMGTVIKYLPWIALAGAGAYALSWLPKPRQNPRRRR